MPIILLLTNNLPNITYIILRNVVAKTRRDHSLFSVTMKCLQIQPFFFLMSLVPKRLHDHHHRSHVTTNVISSSSSSSPSFNRHLVLPVLTGECECGGTRFGFTTDPTLKSHHYLTLNLRFLKIKRAPTG